MFQGLPAHGQRTKVMVILLHVIILLSSGLDLAAFTHLQLLTKERNLKTTVDAKN